MSPRCIALVKRISTGLLGVVCPALSLYRCVACSLLVSLRRLLSPDELYIEQHADNMFISTQILLWVVSAYLEHAIIWGAAIMLPLSHTLKQEIHTQGEAHSVCVQGRNATHEDGEERTLRGVHHAVYSPLPWPIYNNITCPS